MYKNIVAALDGSELAEIVLPHIATVAKGCDEPQITLLRVVEPVPLAYGDLLNEATVGQLVQAENKEKAAAEKYLNRIANKLIISGLKASYKVLSGNAADTIVDYVNNNDIDLVILATHGRSGISRWMWGSVTDKILHHVCAGVLMVRAPGCGLFYKD
jgi:nucleotide-binding universal stress UspA family protein